MPRPKESKQEIPAIEDLDVTKPFFGQVRISPGAAALSLGINIGNRRKRPQFVEFLIKQIKGGEWQEDHPQPIVFSVAGRLIDGQHRLFAISESGETVIATVLCGVRDELRGYLDMGISRTLEDRVQFDTDLAVNKRCASIVSCWYYKDRNYRISKISPEEAREIFAKHEGAIQFAASIMAAGQRGICRAPIMLALAEMFERDEEKAREFGRALLDSTGLLDPQPARRLRDWLLQNSKNSGQAASLESYMRTVCACKAALEGRELKIIKCVKW